MKTWCLSIRQRYILKANHNVRDNVADKLKGVYQYVKDTFWKQITTVNVNIGSFDWVFINTSKIHFESKSQPVGCIAQSLERCLSIRQRYILKANHNCKQIYQLIYIGVYQYVKDTFWKQITTRLHGCNKFQLVFINTSKIHFESKSQPDEGLIPETLRCLSIRQRYILKANHNADAKSEINSGGVYQYVKDTFWKQITTILELQI